MKYPALIRSNDCKTEIHVTIYSNSIGEDGEPIAIIDKTLLCNFQDSGLHRYTNDKSIVELSATVYFSGDPFDAVSSITDGTAFVFGQEYHIRKGQKARNPDGTVNYTYLELI